MSTISQEESLLLQCLATTSLLGELSNANFLESDYYKQLSFSNKNIKNILTQFGLRNPATMQMMLYALLTVPRETLSRTAYSVLETYVERINPLVSTLIETETMSTYDNEDSCEKIDYFRHIRNAVAHSKCNYFSDRGKNFVIFLYDTSEVMNSFIESLKLDSTERTIPVYDISFIQEYLF